MQVLHDTFDMPTLQEFVERTSMIIKKRKRTEKTKKKKTQNKQTRD